MKRPVSAKLLLGLLCTVAAAQTAFAATCEHVVTNEWSTGFTAAIRITNDEASAISGWEVTWEYTDGSVATSTWNADVAGSNPYTATPLGWNSTIEPGQSIEFGVQGSKGEPNAAAPVPAVTGEVCGGDVGSSSSSSSSTSSSSSSGTSSSTSSSSSGGLPSVTLERIFPNLSLRQPTTIVQSPDGSRWFILEKRGRVSWVNADNAEASTTNTYIDLSDIVNANVEGGVLDMAFHPDFESNREVFLSFTEDAPEDSNAAQLSVIARYTESADGAELIASSREDILTLEQPFNNHNGGQMRFGPDGYLYISFGDGGSANDPFNNGQNPDNLFGTLVRIDVDNGTPYSIPADNPFADGGGAPEVYAYGLRNPWRFSFDALTGELWAGDVGQAAFEEINIIESGGNYGWRCREGFEETSNECTTSGPYIDPVIAYSRELGQAVTGGFVYRGASLPSLDGVYVFGDYGSGTIWGLVEPTPGTYEQEVLVETELLVASFAEDIDGELYAVDISGGALYQLVGDGDSSSGSSSTSSSTSSTSSSSSSSTSSSSSSGGAVDCSVKSAVWNSGYQLDVTVTNSSSSEINSWNVAVAFDGEPQVTGGWHAEFDILDNTVMAKDLGWNGTLQPDESTSFGFQGSHDGTFSEPDCSPAN